ncbi:hypothetical protein K466DRAFT_201087 [Polyporus arcularius HHB13444]|uniref:Uncharacterized protein n=1 Tax=Polyporus arcularius HHB13444 TaxID=1314778 RepID=A0A5C3PSG7_9APHY|nr:hypothetical protein K466DRAFT_201087 [Polyporus arcularius HHB13444]
MEVPVSTGPRRFRSIWRIHSDREIRPAPTCSNLGADLNRTPSVSEPLVARMAQALSDKRPPMDEVVASSGDILSEISCLQLRTRLVRRRDGLLLNTLKGVHQLSARTDPHLTGRNASPTPKAASGWPESNIPPFVALLAVVLFTFVAVHDIRTSASYLLLDSLLSLL